MVGKFVSLLLAHSANACAARMLETNLHPDR